ncbi:UDP-glucuronosyltransferase isoform X2 [Salmo salar]|uniref:glucuronosyltransferase n=1 Tax=Salmo salar TaxID=8030 RepID=A0ABM3EH04_SALSA|nr:UDP-glucuronosyltransferase-like isoform X2 [Salmo salar]
MGVTAVVGMCLLLTTALGQSVARETGVGSGGSGGSIETGVGSGGSGGSIETGVGSGGSVGSIETGGGSGGSIETGGGSGGSIETGVGSGGSGGSTETGVGSGGSIEPGSPGRADHLTDDTSVISDDTSSPEIVIGQTVDTGNDVTGVGGPTGYVGRLLVVPMDGSHWVGVKAISEEIGRRGHQVTVVIPEVSMRLGPSSHCRTVSYPVPYSQETVDMLMDKHKDNLRAATLPLVERMTHHMANIQNFSSFILTTAESLLFNTTLITSLEQQGFDAVLTDPLVPTGSLLARRLGVPSVGLLRGIPCGLDLASAACPSPPSYVPRFFTKYTHSMSFPQRVGNVLVSLVEPLLCRLLYWRFDQLANRFLGEDVGVAEVLADTALWLLRYDFTLEFPRPLMPNMVLVGGINCHVRNPLPKELEQWVSGDHGFIVFSLGSMVASLPDDITLVFLQAFTLIPQKVLWRYSGPVPGNIPDNVKMMKWIPQNDLLAHHGARAFLTHSGTHGLYEGVCHAVPMVMLPLFGDQPDNAQRLASKGVGVVLDINHITVETLLQALDEVVNNPRYKSSVLKLSAIHKDQPVDPLELSVYWTEFVMRHKGAAHLRAAAQDLNWFQYHSLDVIGLLIVVASAVVTVTLKCLSRCVRRITTRKMKED